MIRVYRILGDICNYTTSERDVLLSRLNCIVVTLGNYDDAHDQCCQIALLAVVHQWSRHTECHEVLEVAGLSEYL